MSVFKSNLDLLKCLVECIGQICSEWNLELEENETGDQALKVYTFSVRTPDRKACTRLNAVLVFDNQVMMYAKLDGKCRTVNFNVNDYAEAPHSRFPFHGKLNSKLVATIFAPFFRTNTEYHNLSQLSAVATIHICSYLSVCSFRKELSLCVSHTRLILVFTYHRQRNYVNLPKHTAHLVTPQWRMFFGASLFLKVQPRLHDLQNVCARRPVTVFPSISPPQTFPRSKN